MPYADKFEINIVRALADQLVSKFSKLDVGDLTWDNLKLIKPDRQGVYLLFHQGKLVYVGKAKSLQIRLRKHLRKLEGRRNIDVREMGFKCLYIHRNWTALAPENSLIRHYRKKGKDEAAWNGISFGPNDPGRQRETTQKRPDGFDMMYPIKDDWPCDFIAPGDWPVYDLLRDLKKALPYTLRFQKRPSKGAEKKHALKEASKDHPMQGHPDFAGVSVKVPQAGLPARTLLKMIADALPGWQATVFPSHMILYRERQAYEYGEVL